MSELRNGRGEEHAATYVLLRAVWKNKSETATMGIAENLAPSLGVIFACMMNAAPIQSLKGALAAGTLGGLNSTPWAFMFGNCLGWTAYSYLTKGEEAQYSEDTSICILSLSRENLLSSFL
jgi:hypothetical protein